MAVTKRATVFWRVPLLVAFLAVFLSAVLVSGEGSGSEPPTDDGEDSFKTSSAPTPMAFTTGSSPPTAVTPASLTSAFATVNETKPTDGAKDNGTGPISFTQTSTAPTSFKQTSTAPTSFKQTSIAPASFKQTSTAPTSFKQTSTTPTSTAFTTGSDVHSTNLHTGSAPTPASMTSADKSTDVTKASILPTPTGFSTGTPGQTTELSTSNTAAVVTSGFATGSETEPTDVFKTNTIPTDTEFVTGSQTQPTTPLTGTAPTPASPGTLAPPPPPTSLPDCPKMQYHNGTACVSCECASARTDYCDEAKGVCSCLEGYSGKSCQECDVPAGYLPSSNQTCQFCPKCSVNGTATCTETAGMGSSKIVTCQCRSNWEGATCNTCSNLTYRGISHSNDTSFASVDCLPCLCDPKGAASCNVANGDCTCRPGYTGGECQRCASFYYPNKAQHCVKCNCTTHGTLSCQQDTGICHCAAGFQGADCSQCSQQYHRSMDGRCQPCNCSWSGSVGCNSTTGQCLCSSGWTGKQCETCPQFYFISRNTNISGNATGLSNCTASSLGDCNAANFDHMMNVTDLLPPLVCNDSIAECNFTATGLVANGLQCTACQCHRAGSIGCAPLTGVCLCMPGFAGPRCDRCLDFHYHSTNASVCERCNCPSSGSVSCNATSGQCNCRPNHHGERCTNCTNRHYLNDHGFCVACNCSIDGSVGCDPLSGSCSCGPNWFGPHCDICPHLHYTTSNKSVSVPMSGTGTLVNMTMHALNCVPCACHQNGSAGCDRWNGSCHCHTSVTGSDCSVCAMGHFQNSTLPHCDRCDCHRNGSVGCDQRNGNCICRNQTTGSKCDMCKPWFYSPLPHILDCQPCNCSTPGSAFCNRTTGQCGCHRTWTGKRCDQCPHLHYLGTVNKGDDPSCIPCDCSADGTLSCSNNGQCHCRTNVSGDRCDRCAAGNYRTNNSLSSCTDCGCNPNGASGCDWLTGQCNCTSGYIGHQCSSCRHWHFLSSSANPPVCSPCACDTVGSASCSNLTGSCTCRPYIAGALCDRCSTPGTKVQSLENCDDCQCVSNGTQSCNMKTGVCMCRPHVSGLYCGQCSAFAFTTSSLDSCQACSCDKGKSLSCGNTTGTCACRPGAVGAHCSSCAAGYYSNSSGPCQQCDCHPVGAVSCNNDTGACICQPNVDGSHCDRCTHLYYPAPNANKAQALAQCTPCMCDPVGSLSCNASGTCKCHHNVVGSSCDRCAPFHFRNITLTHCSPCNCDQSGSSSCTEETGLCNCRPHATGDRCQTCVQGYYKNSKTGLCVPCTCDALASTSCDPETGNCMCRQDAAGKNCSACSPSYYRPSKLQTCQRCACNTDGTQFCDGLTGKCICKANITGVLCDRCALFFYRAGGSVANCSLCQCHQAGSLSCNEQSGACKCRPSVVGTHCDRCQSFHYQLPSLENCVSCSCFPAGTVSCNQTNGVCNCRDNVNGTTCNQCDSGYFAMPTVASCSKCLCNAVGTQRCDPRNGKCHCRSNVAGSQCSSCAPGYFQNTTLDNCVRCQCDPSGSLGCNQESGECICRPNVGGSRCDSCIALSYPNPSIAQCKPCLCHPIGSSSCTATGHCVCRPNVTGSFCHSCAPGYYSNPTLAQCTVCACDSSRTKRCNPGTGQCACIPNAQGSTCSSCRAGFYYNNVTRSCVSCSCNPLGTASCNSVTGECVCHSNVAGSSCSVCAKGYHRQGQLPNCVKCACNVNGTDICNPFTGACQCKANVLGPVCDSCPHNFYMPSGPGSCRECACNLLGTAQCAGSDGTCQCNSNVIGANCTQCRVNYFQKPSLLNCAPCLCEPTGTESCNRVTGTCTCKTDVAGLRCNRCKAKFFRNPTLANCTACGCNVQGSNRVQCDESSGQCTCRAGVTDRTCNRCQEGYFWPNSSLSCCGSCTTTPGTPCQACRCSAGAVNQSCNATGQCLCRDGHSGLKCNQCAKQSWIFLEESGCADPSNVFYPFGPNVTDQEMSSSSNGSQVKFRVLNLPFGIPIGTTLFRYPSVGISSAGYLTFSRPAPFNPPISFPEGQPIISPYWSITDLRCRGRVYYQIHTSGSVVDRANSDVRALGNATDSSFSARWVLVVTWVDVHAFPDRGNAPALGANSFQAVVTTDGCVSYSMFHYLNGSIVWSGRFNIHARMGYTDGSGVYTYSHPDSSTPAVKTVDLSSNINTTYNGKWMWRITGPCSGTFLAQRKCLKWADDDAILYPEVGDYSEAAQPCPPSFRQAISDQQFTLFRNYKEQRFCVRQRFSSRFSGKRIYSICCYDRKFQGALNIGPPNGGFVTFPNHPHSVAFEMGDEDKRQLCCEQAFICDVFYMRRPSDTGSRYVPPRWTWVFGDPHFRSLDGKSYTFNGWGEYMCFEGDLNMEKVQVNCRTGRLSNPSSTATVFTAFAMGVRNSTGYIQQRLQIEYSNVSNPLTLNVDGADMTSNVTSLMNASQSVSFGHFDVSHDNYSLLSVVFSTGVVVNVSVTAPYILTMSMAVPMTYYDNTRGLQGYFNGDPSDDFKLRNGTVLQANSSERALLPFGQDWQVNSSESLFMYSNGKTYLNYTHPDHVPVFSDEVNASAFPADVRAACGNNTICLYDALESGDVTLGQASQSTTSNLASSENTATNNPPSTAGNGTVYVTGNMTNHFSFTATDSNNFSISLNGTLPSSSEYNLTTLSSGNTTQVNFYWTPSSHSAVTLRFEATDIEGATSTFLPNIVFCGCQNGGTCLPIDMAEVDFGDDSFLLQECSCPDAYSGNRCEADADGCKEVSCYMGVTCTDVPAPGTGANCSDCPAGLTGDGSTCQDLDECTSGTHNCNAAASCTNTDGNYTCQCMTGYSGSGYSCSDVDECMDGHDCHAAANCTNTIGTFACACLLGYSGDGSLECEDINECILDSDDCHTDATCFNHLNGTYSCACSSGYTGNGTYCLDIDECGLSSTHDCHSDAQCSNSAGSFGCACSSGYTGNGTHCADTDECSLGSHNCHLRAACNNTQGNFSCVCASGYSGSGTSCADVDECSDSSHSCSSLATCVNSDGSYNCSCTTGYTGSGFACQDVNECSAGAGSLCVANSSCSNTNGSYLCSCDDGFTGSGNVVCNDIDECSASESPCAGNATCTNTIGEFTCQCDVGFTGNGSVCTDDDECLTAPCDSNATCANTAGSFSCSCNPGLVGDGTYCIDFDECTNSAHNCSNVSTCTNVFRSFHCNCSAGYLGDGATCSDEDECSRSPGPCSANASCANSVGSYSCQCMSGFTGDGVTCSDTDECLQGTHSCHLYATCSNAVGSFSCSCRSGFTGNGTSCLDVNECTQGAHGCVTTASCQNTDGSHTCVCNAGYTGNSTYCSDANECLAMTDDCADSNSNCNNSVGSYVCSCVSGYTGNGSVCIDVDECKGKSHGCSDNGFCSNTIGLFQCLCNLGYGNGALCSDLDECATMTHDCSMLAVCTNTDGSYNCACNSGYTGNGTSCIDVDECMSSPCHTNATCVNNPRSYSCACLPGYTGSGVLCQDVNECELPNTCGPNAHCLNTPGSRSCICNSGYAGDGIQCADVDECKIGTDACHELSHCQNTIGHYKCSCQPGFVGTGLMCRESILFPYGPSQGDRRLVLSSADACSEPFVTPFPVKFGSSTHFKFFICENGLISLSNPFHNFKPEVFPGAQTSNVRNSHIAAPFWSDIDLTRGGNIYYQVYSADSNSAEYSEVLEGVQNLTGLDSFVPLGMFVVTWDEVYTTGNDLNPPNNTFQAVLLADDITSVAIFLFEPNRLNWGQSGNLYAVSGIYTGSDLYKNHPYSGTANIVRLGDTADSAGRQGIYVYIGSSETNITGQTSPFGACQTFVRMDEAALGLVTNLGNDSLVCPCSLNQVSLDFRWSNVAANNTHSCFMPLFTSQFEAVKNCCYSLGGSSGLGALLVGQLYRYDPRAVPSLHSTYDAEPFRQCCLLSVLCANFSSRRPDDTCAGYAPPLLTLAWGDPHLKTLDGKFYTFNGRGEYILLETVGGTFSLQGRTTLFNGTTATTFSAVAMKQFTGMASPTVEVQLTSNNTLAVLVDGNAIGPGPYSNVSFAWPNNDTSSARIVFGTGLVVTVEERMGTMAVVTSTPMSFSGNTRGLYGVWNNDPADDFTLPNNTVLHVNSSERTLFDFGQEWQVTSSQSLFTYGAGLSVLTYSFPDHMPIFSDEIPASNYSDLQTVCSGNPSCLFDALVSGNVALGLASMNTENTVLNDSNTLQNFPPAFHGSVLFAAELNVQATYTVTVNDTDNFTVTAQGLPAGSYTLTLLNGLVTLLWTPTSTDAVTVVLSATDTASASTHLNLMTVLCACQNGANCLPVTSTSSPFSTNACNCSAAYTGSFCEADLDGCATQGCATGVVCTDNVAPMTGYTCGDCPAGLTGDGVRCLDINECNTSTHGCAQTCVNSYASYTCSCAVGYTLAMNGRDCTNVNECGGGSGPCHQVCQDTEGSYNCSCNPGFTLFAGNNQSCNASVNCPPGHGCEHDCAVVNSVNVCSCNQGYVLVQPGNTNCNDVNECAGAGTCSQNCTNTPGSYSCSCFSGFNLDTDGISCIDIDECLNPSICNVSGSLCHNTVGGYTCNCTDGTHNVGGICQALPQIILPPNQPTTMATTVMTTISATTTVPPATTASNIQSGVTANFLNLTTAQVASQQSIMLAIIRNTTIQLCRTNLTCFGGNTTAIENIQVTFHRVAAASVGGTTLVVVVEAFGSALPSSLLTNVLGSALLASMLQNAGLGQVSVVQTGAQEESSSSNLGAILGGAIGGVGVLGVMVGAAVKYKMSSGGANITRQRARFSFRKKRSPWDTSVDGTSGKTRRQPSMKWARQASDLFMKPNAVATAADLEAVEMGQSGQVKESSLVADTAAEPRYAGNAAPNTAAEAAAPVYETASDDTTAPGRQHQTSVSFVNKPAALNL